ALFDPTRNPKAERIHLSPRSELVTYSERVRDLAIEVLSEASPDHPDPLLRDGYVGEMVYEHECQHQAIVTFLLQMLPPARTRRPKVWDPPSPGTEPRDEMETVPGGVFLVGASLPGFSYDNEREPHPVTLDDFRIVRSPVTELAFLRFIEAG